MWMIWLFVSSLSTSQAQYCHSTDPKPYVFYGTKTPYELINNEDSSPVHVSGCAPIMFWMVARHGTRYPPAQQVTVMKERLPRLRRTILQNHQERRGTLCQPDVDALANNGSVRIDENFDEALTATGREELLLLGRRFRGRFADFFDSKPYNERLYFFRHIASASSQASARSFSRGIFSDVDVLLTEAPPNDRLLQFSDNCTLWEDLINRHDESDREFRLFRQSPTFQSTLADVTARLGFQYNMSTGISYFFYICYLTEHAFTVTIFAEDMLLIYDICRYQKAWNLEQIPSWCSAFTTDNLKVLEYAEDLKAYYKQGYGFELNFLQACPLLHDLVRRIRIISENGTANQQRGVFYFTEGDTVLRLTALLGLAKDERPPTHDMIQFAERKWRTSFYGSFAANLAVVLYNCAGEYKVQVFAKEVAVRLDQCQEALCTIKEFLDHFGPVAKQCDTKDVCDPNSVIVHLPLGILPLISLVVVNIFVSY